MLFVAYSRPDIPFLCGFVRLLVFYCAVCPTTDVSLFAFGACAVLREAAFVSCFFGSSRTDGCSKLGDNHVVVVVAAPA